MLNDDNRLEVADVCQRLDGIPLAIELAANRVRSMTVPEIREHLRSRFRLLRSDPHAGTKRHRTLQAAVQWSYDLLDARHQRIFRQLSIFAGGFTVDAVVAVCDDCTMDAVDALDALDALVARSVVIADRTGATTRYSLLETLGQFGQDTLAAEGETVGCRARHARHFLGVAEAARHQLSTPDAAAAMTTFEEEWSNLRIAFEWFATNGDVDAALRIVVACYWFAGLSHRYELLSWSERAIALATADQHELWPAAAGVTALLRWGTGDTPGANAITEVASRVETANALRPRFEPALAHAIACVRSEHPERGIELARAAERIAASGADPIELAIARSWLLAAHVVAGRDDLADLADLAVRDAEVTRNPHQLAFAYLGQVAVAAVNHDKPAATEAYSLALRWAEVANNRRVIDNAPLWLATAMTDAPLEALRLVRGVLASFYDAGFWPILPFALEVTFESLSRLDQFHAAALALGGITDNPNTFQRSALEVLGPDLDRLLHQGQTCTRSELVEELLGAIDDCLQGRDPPETEAGHLRKTDRRRTTALR
jgi:hypothetical protein